MGRPAKILALIIASILALFAVGAIKLIFFFDPNDFREDIAAAVYDSTGRELRIDGDISVQLFPWLAVEVGHTALGGAEGFGDAPFMEFDEARLSVQVLPLILRRETKVGTASIDGLRLHLEVDNKGRANWADLMESDGVEASPGAGEVGSASLDVSGIDISDALITYSDLQAGASYEVTDVNFHIGRISSDGEPGVMTIDGISLAGVAAGVVDTPTRLSFETAGIEVRSAESLVSIEPIAISLLDIDIEAEVKPFSYSDAVEPTAGIRVAAFSPRSLMHLFGVDGVETADPNALTSLSIEAQADVRASHIALTDVSIELDDITFEGSMTVPTDAAGRIVVDLRADALDLNRYMAPPSEESADAADEVAPVEIPADLIKPLNARGDLKVGAVTVGNLLLEQVVLSINVADGRLRMHPISAGLYGGSYSGDVRIDATAAKPVLSINETVNKVDLAKLAQAMFEQDNITGSISGNFNLTGRGDDLGEVQRSLNGRMTFALNDGTYEGTDIWYELRRARALVKQETPPEPVLPARTKFTSVTATGVVTDGIMRNDDLVAELPFMQLNGSGDVDIPAGTIDYDLTARVFRKAEALEEATPEELEDLTKTVIPLKIEGPLSSPKVSPDVEALLRQRVEDEVKDRLEDKLKDLFKR